MKVSKGNLVTLSTKSEAHQTLSTMTRLLTDLEAL